MIDLENISTEQRNEASFGIDRASTLEMIRLIHEEDRKAVDSISPVLPRIGEAIDEIAQRMRRGGRLIYVGAGSSGRLGVLDAAECPPTFGTSPEQVIALIAGGSEAMFRAREGAEDSAEDGARDLKATGVCETDSVVGIAASGRTPYVVGALRFARSRGALAVAVACSQDSPIEKIADIAIVPLPGPEVITGSTRMKAGTAEKLILNMISTGVMIRLGKVYENLMVDVSASNEKLRERARRIVMEATGCTREESIRSLDAAGGSAKLAILMIKSGASADVAKKYLDEAEGNLARTIKFFTLH